MSLTTMKVETATRDRVMKVAEQFGVSADAALQRLLDEHWERECFEALERYREEDPEGYADYLAELDEWDRGVNDPIGDPWEGEQP